MTAQRDQLETHRPIVEAWAGLACGDRAGMVPLKAFLLARIERLKHRRDPKTHRPLLRIPEPHSADDLAMEVLLKIVRASAGWACADWDPSVHGLEACVKKIFCYTHRALLSQVIRWSKARAIEQVPPGPEGDPTAAFKELLAARIRDFRTVLETEVVAGRQKRRQRAMLAQFDDLVGVAYGDRPMSAIVGDAPASRIHKRHQRTREEILAWIDAAQERGRLARRSADGYRAIVAHVLRQRAPKKCVSPDADAAHTQCDPDQEMAWI